MALLRFSPSLICKPSVAVSLSKTGLSLTTRILLGDGVVGAIAANGKKCKLWLLPWVMQQGSLRLWAMGNTRELPALWVLVIVLEWQDTKIAPTNKLVSKPFTKIVFSFENFITVELYHIFYIRLRSQTSGHFKGFQGLVTYSLSTSGILDSLEGLRHYLGLD